MELPPRARLERYVERARGLEQEGLSLPHESLVASIDADLRAGRRAEALAALTSAESRLEAWSSAWAPVRELLARDDRLRAAALDLGLDPPSIGGGRGSPRELLQGGPVSEALLAHVQSAAASSTRAVTHQILQHGVSESRKLATRIRAASQRGEDVSETTEAFRRLVRTIGARAALDVGERLAELRHAAARIPSAPASYLPMTEEEQEVLGETRQFGRRINRIKHSALDAQSAARMVSHVHAALSEDRRLGSPQEEVEELWGEVARLTTDRDRSGEPAPKPRTGSGDDGSPRRPPPGARPSGAEETGQNT
jgi:hypothetical protein